MNKNNKRKSAIAAMALTLIVGAGSMAYFTDQKFGGVTATAANVSLGEFNREAGPDAGPYVPGDDINLNNDAASIQYNGNVEARYRVMVEVDESDGRLPYNPRYETEEGFHFIDSAGEPVELEREGNKIKLAEGLTSELDSNLIEIGNLYRVHVNEVTSNTYQDKEIKFTIKVEVLQKGHTTENWQTEGAVNKDITIVAK